MSGPVVVATIQVSTGLQANLPVTGTLGTPYFCTDTGNLYVWSGTAMVQINGSSDPTEINGVTFTNSNPTLGQVPIAQGDGTALWADPFVQGPYAPGTNVATGGIASGPINPVLLGGSDGTSLRTISTDISGQLKVLVEDAVAVTGSFYQVTQPVSASALPLPSNAAQETGGNLAAAKSDLDTIAGAVTSSKVQVNVTNTSVPVTGTFFQSVQPVSLPTCVPNVQQALTTTAQIKSSAGTFWGFDWYNPNTSPVYVFVYNQTSAPTPGSSSNLIYQKALPAGAGSNEDFTIGKACSAGIYIAVSTLPSGNTAPSTGLVLTTSYV